MKPFAKALSLIATSVLLTAFAASATAQGTYPDRPIKLVVGFSPGGLSDTMARAIAVEMSDSIGQPVVVENRTGAGSTIAGDYVAKSDPDGYTVWLQDMTNHAINSTLYKNLPYDSLKDFTPVTFIAMSPLVVITNPEQGAESIQQLVEMIKAEPGKYSYASAGAGTGNHLGAEMLKAQSGLDVVHVPYKGSTPSVVSVLSGDTLFSLVTVPSSLQHIESGGLRALAVTTPNRVSALPDLPTLVESGHDVEIASVSGILLPAGASADVVARLHEEFAKATETESVRQVYAQIGAERLIVSPEEMGARMKSDIEKFAPLVEAAGVKVE